MGRALQRNNLKVPHLTADRKLGVLADAGWTWLQLLCGPSFHRPSKGVPSRTVSELRLCPEKLCPDSG